MACEEAAWVLIVVGDRSLKSIKIEAVSLVFCSVDSKFLQ
jgi:hypothetical protein